MRFVAMSLPLLSLCLAGSAQGEGKDSAASKSKWTSLFNGKNLDGWTGVSSSLKDDWKVADGVLTGVGSGGGWIVAPGDYSDFRLQLEFRVTKGANSGVYVRTPRRAFTPHREGLEIQILDDYARANVPNASRCGSLLLEKGPSKKVSKKAGEWQQLEIECIGSRVRVTLNKREIVNVDLSKTKPLESHPGRNRKSGAVGLQDHGERVSFRKIRIQKLK